MSDLVGYTGKLLRVDLSNETFTDVIIDEKMARDFIGGTGFGVKIIYDEVPADVAWNDERNRWFIGSGPLGGTVVGGSGTVSVVVKGPMTNGAAATQANGFFGAFLRFCGYEGIIIQGKAKRWSYLLLTDDGVELCDATHLVGKDTWETSDLIKEKYGKKDHGMSVAAIGPAGEHLVRYAPVVIDKDHVPSHNGNGAVLASKRLKAIAGDRGKKKIPAHDPVALGAVAKAMKADNDEYMFTVTGTTGAFEGGVIADMGVMPILNYSTSIVEGEHHEDIDKFGAIYTRSHHNAKRDNCWGCIALHNHKYVLSEGHYKGEPVYEAEYEGLTSLGPIIGNYEASSALYLSNLADRLGLDVNELGWSLGLAIECYEKGVISKEQADGLELSWGNYLEVEKLMYKIAKREGFGNVLAEGAMRAAEIIGGDAPNFAVGTKKYVTPRTVEIRPEWQWILDHAISNSGTNEGFEYVYHPADVGLDLPDGYRISPCFSAEEAVDNCVKANWSAHFLDCLGVCWFSTAGDFKRLSEALRAVTGWDFPATESAVVGLRIQHLLRAFNIRCGHTAEMDTPSLRLGGPPADGMAAGQDFLAHMDEMRTGYYTGKGWDPVNGKPLPETLKKFGLDYAISEMWESES